MGMPSPASTSARRGVFAAAVLSNEPLCREHWRLVLRVETFPPAQPGQFVQLLCRPSADAWTGGAFTRRPFSIGGLRREASGVEIDILHRAIGPGTRYLAGLHAGDVVSVLGPLGNAFPMPPAGAAAYLVGGGIGLPPLVWLAEQLAAAGREAVAFVGARCADLLPLSLDPSCPPTAEPSACVRELATHRVPCLLATDDASLGVAGRIPDAFATWIAAQGSRRSAVVYTCGPEAMMKAVAAVCPRHGVQCRACLERMMACGMGTCQSCVVRVDDPAAVDGWVYRLCCTDGPVFDAALLKWSVR